ncbi:aldo/keto reductase [Colwellia sp. C1TZA3]|uniref:aldo/keto reductase n=1 Tax=Colwellia sp. C1TZA3 TaxID=2508879 RepID=UPI0011B9A143|nr:aldo/keto reductase [Colwellia sp. C1TZA3]TWX70435.1 aldo/keto reductase [Colwellia sp. C1TZA3]
MKKRILGSTGFDVSEIGLGCWQLGNDFGPLEDKQAQDILSTATNEGINLLDTADVYGGGISEERIGKWLKKSNEKPFVITKVGRGGTLFPAGYTKAKVKENIQGSLTRLGLEALDLVQLHCIPPEVLRDGEIFNWLEDFQQQGLIKNFGASVEMIDDAIFCCQVPKLATVQIIFNIFRQAAIETLLPKAAENNIGVIVRLPLASGLLSGKMTKNQQFSAQDHRHYNKDGAAFHVGETFNGLPFNKGVELADQLKAMLPSHLNLLETSLRWLLDQPQISTIIAGASSTQQVINNAQVSNLTPLDEEVDKQLKMFYQSQVKQHIRGGI